MVHFSTDLRGRLRHTSTIGHPGAHTPNQHSNTQASQHDHTEEHRHSNTQASQHDHTEEHRHSNTQASQHDHTEEHRHSNTEAGQRGSRATHHLGDGAEPGHSAGAGPHHPAGRSIQHWRPAQAPNQLVIIAEIGVIDGTKPDGTCELLGAGPVPPSILDNLSPDTRIAGALFDTNGEILWLGRSRRQPSIAQQLAVAVRDRGCVLCRSPMHRCDYHHINEWAADNGNTDTANLAALCNDCHDKLHKNNQRLQQRPGPARWTTTHRSNTTGQTSHKMAKGPP